MSIQPDQNDQPTQPGSPGSPTDRRQSTSNSGGGPIGKKPAGSDGGSSNHRKVLFPPKLRLWEWLTLVISYIALVFMSLYLLDQLFIQKYRPPSVLGSYIAFGIVLTMVLIDRIVRHKLFVHKARLEDPSEIDALMVEAMTVESRLTDQEKPDNFGEKKSQLEKEVNRLKEEVTDRGWTEYQTLSLDQMLVDFLKVDDLIERAQLSLAELEDFAKDSAYRYDYEQYYSWEIRIKIANDKIDEASGNSDDAQRDNQVVRDKAAEPLRAALRTLLEHLADYKANWSEGSAISSGLMTRGCVAIPLLLAMGLLPVLHPSGEDTLGILNWGLLGVIGSISAVLLDLRRSNLVEVGNTQGKKELRRAILGAALGLLAGVLTYASISGELLSAGSAVPKVDDKSLRDIGLSIVWAVASGVSFDRVFGRILRTTEGETQ